MTEQTLLYLSRADVEQVGLEMPEVIEVVHSAFREKGRGEVQMPPKPAVHPGVDSFAHAMPAFIRATRSLGMKWVGGNPHNPKRGVPYITGLVVLNDPETVAPIAVMDCTWITAQRTGAATAVAAHYLAREDAQTLGVLGAGVQGFSNLEALRVLFPIDRLTVYDVDPDQLTRYQQRVRERFPEIQVAIAHEPREAVTGMDLVVTAGPIVKPPHGTIKPGWLSPGAFAAALDYDSYWDREALREADKIVTDDLAQLEDHQRRGYFQDFPPIHADLGELAVAGKKGREAAEERIVAFNLGLAIDDLAVAPLVYERALQLGLGRVLPL
ncbi:ornithine cyclodeaminase family protein [Gemmatimonadota bacterium]